MHETAAAAAYRDFQRTRFFGSLDGLRAISILAVIWHHAAAPYFPPTAFWVHEGNRGVHLFFVISAFLISTLLLRAKAAGTLDVPRFWCRRALRILPLYYAVLLLYVVLVFVAERDTDARNGFFENVKYFATFTSNWFVALDSPRVIFYFAWSLAAEEQFYLCWPWVERALNRFWPVVVALAALCVTQAAGLARLNGFEALPLTMAASVPSAILLGVVLAHVLNDPRGFAVVYSIAGRRWVPLVALALVIAALASEHRIGFAGELVVAAALVSLVAACVVREDNLFAPVLRLRPIAWIGTISFGIYLLHMLCITAARKALGAHADALTLFITATLGSIAVASLSYVTYERQFLRLKERWFGERTGASARSPVHPVPPAPAPVYATARSSTQNVLP